MVNLIDSRARSRTYGTWRFPSARLIDSIGPRSLVKIAARIPSQREIYEAERFWVVVTRRAGNTMWGRVNNELFFTRWHKLKFGSLVRFQTKNLLDVQARKLSERQMHGTLPRRVVGNVKARAAGHRRTRPSASATTGTRKVGYTKRWQRVTRIALP